MIAVYEGPLETPNGDVRIFRIVDFTVSASCPVTTAIYELDRQKPGALKSWDRHVFVSVTDIPGRGPEAGVWLCQKDGELHHFDAVKIVDGIRTHRQALLAVGIDADYTLIMEKDFDDD